MRKVLIISGIVLLVVFSIPAIVFYWLCYTESGLHWLAGRTQGLKTARIEFEGLTGYLAGPIHVDRFVLDHPRVRIDARDVNARVHLSDLWVQTVHVEQAEAARIAVQLRRVPPSQEKREPRFLPAWLRIRASRIDVARANLLLQNGMDFDAAPVRASATLTTDELVVSRSSVNSEKYTLSGPVTLRARDPIALEGSVDWLVTMPEQPRYAGQVTFLGDLAKLDFKGGVTQPFIASYEGSALDLTAGWNWQATASTSGFNLKPWQPDSNLGAFAAALKANGSSDSLNVSGVITPKDLDTGPLAVSLRGAYRDRRLRADELVVSLQGTRGLLQARGEFMFDGGVPSTRLDGRWSRLQWPLKGTPLVRSPAGEFSIGGEMPFLITLKGDVDAGGRFPAATFSARTVLAQGRISAPQFHAKALQGEIGGNGELSWSPAKSWRAGIEATALDPRVLHAEFPGRVNFRLTGSGTDFDAKSKWDVALENVSGTLRSQPISGRARVRHEHGTYRISNGDVRFGGAHLVANGVYGPVNDLNVTLDAPDLARVIPEIRGGVNLRAGLQGDEKTPLLKINVRAQGLEYERYRVQQVTADGQIDLRDQLASWLTLDVADLGMEERRLRSIRARLEGRASRHELDLAVNAGNAQVSLHTRGGYEKETWTGVLDALSFAAGETRMNLDAPAKLAASRKHALLEQACLVGGEQRACAQGQWQMQGPWNVEIVGTDLPLKTLAAGLPRPLEYSGTLDLDIRASGSPRQPWTGVARADFSNGVFRYKRAGGKIQSVAIGTGRAQFAADVERYTARLNLRAEPGVRIRGEARARRRSGEAWQQLPLAGSIEAETNDLGFIPILVPEVDRASGNLKADLTLNGRLGSPRFDGALDLTNGEMDLYAVNLLLREIGMDVELAGNSLNLTANAVAGKGRIAVNGDVSWSERQPKGTLRLTGENLLLADVPEARIVASPNLRFRVDGRRIDVDGAVRVPNARLAPANLTGAMLPSEDEVIVGEETQSPESRFIVTTGVHLILGDDVTIESYGLTGKLGGGVLVYSATGEVSTGIGEIKVEEGKYTFYSRELDIEFGRLVFSGGPLGDPGVDLRAIKQYPDVLAGVNVRGTLRNPRVSFFSDPPLPQTQIVSILVAGRTLDSLQDGGATSGSMNSTALLAQGGAILANRLGEQLGLNLDEISVESESADETSLVLGKYLSPRLYVSYGISLTEAINTLKLRYTISDHWTIKTEAGEARSADIVFTIDRGGPESGLPVREKD
jgi:translocation and assembly module TamB